MNISKLLKAIREEYPEARIISWAGTEDGSPPAITVTEANRERTIILVQNDGWTDEERIELVLEALR